MLPETMAILANLFRDYWATPEQREMIIQSEKEEAAKLQASEKQYDAKDMFSKIERENDEANKALSQKHDGVPVDSTEESDVSGEVVENKELPVEKKAGIFQSIINWFKGLFGKKSS